jgi:hypothetical protein
VFRTIDVVNVRREYISRLLIYTPLVRNIKLFNSETVDEGLVSIDNRIVAIDLNSLLVIRNGK